jgi:hypothetical protein
MTFSPSTNDFSAAPMTFLSAPRLWGRNTRDLSRTCHAHRVAQVPRAPGNTSIHGWQTELVSPNTRISQIEYPYWVQRAVPLTRT